MPHNQKIGHFMVAVGVILENVETGLVLVQQRGPGFQANEWELPYGRVDQFEELSEAITREMFEETGLTDIKPIRLLRVWHFFRGEKSAETEVYGLTFHCQTNSTEVKLSEEHLGYKWVAPAAALELIQQPGIKADMQIFHDWQQKNWQNYQITFGAIGKPRAFQL